MKSKGRCDYYSRKGKSLRWQSTCRATITHYTMLISRLGGGGRRKLSNLVICFSTEDGGSGNKVRYGEIYREKKKTVEGGNGMESVVIVLQSILERLGA